jgi:hypothetical protein
LSPEQQGIVSGNSSLDGLDLVLNDGSRVGIAVIIGFDTATHERSGVDARVTSGMRK